MFFSLPYEYTPCGLFGRGHALLFCMTALLIAGGLYAARGWDDRAVRRTVRVVTALLWALDAGLFSSVGKGRLRRLGDVFLATGGLIGGACFLICPDTSLPRYPVFHFISFHSFLLHGLMVFLGLLLLLRGVVRLRPVDVVYCAGLVSAMCAAALAYNNIYSAVTGTDTANLMFMSRDFPGTPVHLLYALTGRAFPVAMWLLQAFAPYYAVFGAVTFLSKKKKNCEKMVSL